MQSSKYQRLILKSLYLLNYILVGIVRFETQFTVLSPAITQHVNFVSTSDVMDEATSLSVTWNDGDKLDVTVRAYDIFDIFIDDAVTVYKDTSSPEIENLWLSNGYRVNVSVHSFEDFSKMTYVRFFSKHLLTVQCT